MRVDLPDSFYLSEILPSDRNTFVDHFKEKEIYNNTLHIPFPYTQEDADEWIDWSTEQFVRYSHPVNLAIRKENGFLVGGIGLDEYDLYEPHKSELGYWLAKEFWGQGIMTNAVKAFTNYANSTFGISRITAHVFHFNKRSARVLEKSGFQLEGHLRKYYLKDGRIFDGLLYAKIY